EMLAVMAIEIGQIQQDLARHIVAIVRHDLMPPGRLTTQKCRESVFLRDVSISDDALGPAAGRRTRGDFLSDDRIDQSALADVLATDDAHKIETVGACPEQLLVKHG